MSSLIVDDRGAARWIRFNRPEALNTLKREDLDAAREATLEAAEQRRPVVFTGEGDRAFCAGMNLDLFMALVEDPSQTRDQIGAVRALLDAVRTAEVVTVAAINGHCLGAAFELALACDFRISEPGALLGLPEMKLGLPCIMDSAVLHQYVGLSLAKEMMLTGRLYPATTLAANGVVRVLGEGETLGGEVDALVASFEGISAAGIASQKRLFETWQNEPLHTGIDISLDEIVEIFHDPETRERLSAYEGQLRGRAG